jgi:hypothetical protein
MMIPGLEDSTPKVLGSAGIPMTDAMNDRRWWLADIVLVASLIPLIPTVMDLLVGNLPDGSGEQVIAFTLIALFTLALTSFYLWRGASTRVEKTLTFHQTLVIMGTAFIALAVAVQATEGERSLTLLVTVLFGAVFPLVALGDHYLRPRRGEQVCGAAKETSALRLMSLYILALVAYTSIIFLTAIATRVTGGLSYFWDEMGEGWVRPLYSMVLPFNSLMTLVMTAVVFKVQKSHTVMLARLIVIAVQFWLCVEAFDLVMYYWW